MMTIAPAVRDITMPTVATSSAPMTGIARLHHTRWAERSFSFTHTTPMELSTPSTDMVRRCIEAVNDQLGVDVSECRLIELTFAQAADDALTPVTAIWCLDADNRLVAALVNVSITGEGTELCAVKSEQFRSETLTGTIDVHASGRLLPGRVHLTLTPGRVAVGVQVPVDGTPALTASISGEFTSREPRSTGLPQDPSRTNSARRERAFRLRLVR